jgi:hypothetical protein
MESVLETLRMRICHEVECQGATFNLNTAMGSSL